jgi:2-polyprenyl-3-methyl-5-hydroxy-6-metoxy-1,4-benzoquinol methylase
MQFPRDRRRGVSVSASLDAAVWEDNPSRIAAPAAAPVCPSCKHGRFRPVPLGAQAAGALTFAVLECESCALCHLQHHLSRPELDAYTSSFYSMIADSIAVKSEKKSRRFFDERTTIFAGIKPGQMLDVGCQHGLFLEAMKHKGWDVAGVEPMDQFARMARSRLGVPIYTTRLEELRSTKTYDLVTLWHVLEHFEDPLAALQHCSTLLRPGGRIFFEVPNIDSLGAMLGRSFWPAFRDPTHRWFFRPEPLRRMAARAGLKVVSIAPASTPAAWYTLKRGIGSRALQEDHWWQKMAGRPRSGHPVWRRALRSVATFYPFMRAMAWLGNVAGRGEVLHGWLERI